MKKSIFTWALMLLATMAMAESDIPQGLGFQIGFSEPVLRLNSPSSENKKELDALKMNGFKVGLTYDCSYWKGFGSSVGFNYTYATGGTKWQALNDKNTLIQSRTRTSYNQLEVFVDWQYKFTIAKETYLILYSGPTVQCALDMHQRYFLKENNLITEQSKVECFDYNDEELRHDYQRLNVTWGVGAGFQYQRYFIRGGYDFGLINPYRTQTFEEMGYKSDGRYTRGRFDQWQIKIGIYFWQND